MITVTTPTGPYTATATGRTWGGTAIRYAVTDGRGAPRGSLYHWQTWPGG